MDLKGAEMRPQGKSFGGQVIVHCCHVGRMQGNLGTRISYHGPASPTVVGPPKATEKPWWWILDLALFSSDFG